MRETRRRFAAKEMNFLLIAAEREFTKSTSVLDYLVLKTAFTPEWEVAVTTRQTTNSHIKMSQTFSRAALMRALGWMAFLAAYGVVAVLVLMPGAFF